MSKNKDEVSNGCILCDIKRQANGSWTVKARGYYTRNTRTASEVILIV
jgi:hypothetical protein